MIETAPVLAHADSIFPESLARLIDLLRIPSVSADPALAGEVERAAEWLRAELASLGFQVDVRPTGGLPMVVAHHQGPGADGPASVPHLLYYGHYDVQPAAPVELWRTPPFEPAVVEAERGPRLVGRGAADDKGQLMTFIEAFRAWIAVYGTLPARVSILLEGEEESGSPSLVAFLDAHREELAADVCIITDTNGLDVDTPAITTRLRGLVFEEVTLTGPSHDLHSGLYGGVALNPLNALTRILGGLQDESGRVLVPGFYDGVTDPTEDERAMWRELPLSEPKVLAEIGLTAGGGESDRPFLERMWTRPTCDINGVRGGHIGDGPKTVIPAEAVAKVSFRLVPGQNPERIVSAFRTFVRERAPAGSTVSFRNFGSSPAYVVAPGHPYLDAALAGLGDVCPRRPFLIGSGASIPIAHHIKTILGFDSLLVGFGLDDDLIHSPNEKFELACFRMGIRGQIAMLARFATLNRQLPNVAGN